MTLKFIISFHISYFDLQLVCPVCFEFLKTLHGYKQLKNTKITDDDTPCQSIYHKKLTDGFKT